MIPHYHSKKTEMEKEVMQEGRIKEEGPSGRSGIRGERGCSEGESVVSYMVTQGPQKPGAGPYDIILACVMCENR